MEKRERAFQASRFRRTRKGTRRGSSAPKLRDRSFSTALKAGCYLPAALPAAGGHEGDNAGESTVIAILAGQQTEVHGTPVYGCSLLGECTTPMAPDITALDNK